MLQKNVSNLECLRPIECLKSSSFRRRQNTGSDVADCTSSNRLCQTAAAAAVRTQLPMVAHWVWQPACANSHRSRRAKSLPWADIADIPDQLTARRVSRHEGNGTQAPLTWTRFAQAPVASEDYEGWSSGMMWPWRSVKLQHSVLTEGM